MKEGSRNGACLRGDSMKGTRKGAPLLGTAKDMLKRYIKRNVNMSFKRVCLTIRAPFGSLERIRLLGLFDRNI